MPTVASRASNPVLIAGFGRSGTTLLLSLLDGHPELCVFPKESEFFTVARAEILQDRYRGVNRFFARSMLGAQFVMAQEAVRIPIDKDQYLDSLNQRWQAHNFKISEFLAAAVLAYGDVSGQADRKLWVEKTPMTEHYGRLISEWYPRVKMLYVVRDPRGNYSSLQTWRLKKGNRITVRQFAYQWENSVSRNKANHGFIDVLDLRYEDLVTQTTQSMRRVCDFLGITFHESLLRPTIAGRQFGGNSIYGASFSGISDSSLDRWRDVLSATETRLIQSLLGRWMRYHGYELDRSGAIANTSGKAIVVAHILKKIHVIYGNSPDGLKGFYGQRVRNWLPQAIKRHF